MPLEAVYYDQITYGRHPHHLVKFPAQEPLRHPEWIFRLSTGTHVIAVLARSATTSQGIEREKPTWKVIAGIARDELVFYRLLVRVSPRT